MLGSAGLPAHPIRVERGNQEQKENPSYLRPTETGLPLTRRGKSLRIYRIYVKSQNQKYFAFPERQIRGTSIAIPSRSEGRIMIVTNVGRDAVDAGSADNERRESVRRSRVVLTPRCWRQVCGKSR